MIRGFFALVRLVNWFCCSRIVRGNLTVGCIADGTVSGFRILRTYVVVVVVV